MNDKRWEIRYIGGLLDESTPARRKVKAYAAANGLSIAEALVKIIMSAKI